MLRYIIRRLRGDNTLWHNLNNQIDHMEKQLLDLQAQCKKLEANQALLVSCLLDLTEKLNEAQEKQKNK